MGPFVLKISALLTLLALGNLVEGDECSTLFFTPAWQECFQRKFHRNWVRRNAEESFPKKKIQSQPRVFPTIRPFIMPNIEEIISKAKAQHTQVQGVPGSSSFSSSSFTSSSQGTSTSVMSANGRTWTIVSNGLSVSSSNAGTTRYVKVVIGEPKSVKNSFEEEENSVQVDFKYGDGITKWVKITLDSPTKVKDLVMERRNGILYITGEM